MPPVPCSCPPARRRPRTPTGALTPYPRRGSKRWSKTYAHEVASTPIKVNLLNPGPVRTTMRQRAFPGENPASLPEPEALVPLFLDLVDAGQSESGLVYDFKTAKSN